jgi:hypothetical protein
MRTTQPKTAQALLICVVLLAAAPSRAFWWGPSAESRWRDRTITIDGRDDDWKDQDADDAEGVAFAFANDEKDLYVLISPHTKSLKQQLAGNYDQDFSIWVDTSVGKNKRVAVRLLAPASFGATEAREVETVGIDTDSIAAKDSPDLRIGPMDERGVLEARIPLSYLGASLPKKISVGLETSIPKRPPPAQAAGRHPARESPADQESGQEMGGSGRGHGRKGGTGGKHGDAGSKEEFEPLDLWIRVTLSAPGSRP